MTDNTKRALGIGGVSVAGILLFLRRRQPATAAAATGPTTGSVAPFVPQASIPLQPGESIYDPNSQALLTTPAGLPTAPALMTLPAKGQALTSLAPAYVVNVNYPKPVTKTSTAKKPTKRKPSASPHHRVPQKTSHAKTKAKA